MRITQEKIKEFIISSGLLPKETVNNIFLKSQKNDISFEDLLIKEGLLSKERIEKIRAYLLGVPFLNLEHEKIPEDVLNLIPEPIARNHQIVPYRKKGDTLEVAMLDPEDLQTLEFIKKKTGLKIEPRLTSSESLENVFKQYQKTLEVEFSEIVQIKDTQNLQQSAQELSKTAAELPVIKIVDTIIKHAVLEEASDIHIEPMEEQVLVRYRVDGLLRDATTLPLSSAPAVVARIKILSSLKLDEHRLPQDGRFKVKIGQQEISIRVSILPVYNGEKVVMRLLKESTGKNISLEDLGLWGQALEIVKNNIKRPYGMILVTGPTGSGKTTTLYTILNMLNRPEVNISTIEDPIEYRMPRINQTQVKPEIGLTFAAGLRALLRQDPNIIMVGEIRDNETAALAVHAALTGHLVLSTLHTTTAAGAFARLLDMKIEGFLLASTINLVIAQRLVRKLIPESKKSYNITKEELTDLKKQFDLEEALNNLKAQKAIDENINTENLVLYKPLPTADSLDGFKGRIGIYEVIETNDEIRKLIIQGADTQKIAKEAQKNKMITMLEDGLYKSIKGITTIESVLSVIKQ
jgi:type IV pilus assembly protein PilB